MPIYEYQCSKCGHEYEIIQKMSDSPIVECEKCHQPSAVRLVSAPGFQLKGTGWYETDFKHKGKPKEQSTEKVADNQTNKSEEKVAVSEEKKPAKTTDEKSSSLTNKGESK